MIAKMVVMTVAVTTRAADISWYQIQQRRKLDIKLDAAC